jgi:MFS family permease
MSVALPLNAAVDGHRVVTVAALMATYMEAVNISLPNAALPYIQGTLSMANDEAGWVFTAYMAAGATVMPMARWLAGRYGRKTVYQVALAVFDDVAPVRVRPDRPGSRERRVRAFVSGYPAGCAAAAASCPDHPGVVGVHRARHQQRRQYRRLAQ